MKRNRIIWLVLWILSIVGISFFGGYFSYGFFVALTLIPVFSLLYLAYIYLFFHIAQDIRNRYAVVNEKIPYYFSLVNEYPILFSGVRVIFYSSFSTIHGLSDETEYELFPRTGIHKETQLICRYRGEYKVGIKEIELQDYFRLFRISYKNKESVTAVVRPQLVCLESLGAIELVNAVRNATSLCMEPDIETREYIPGDEIRMINWSQSARTGTLLTRKMIGQEFRQISIILDTYRESKEDKVYFPLENKMLELELAVAYYLSRNKIKATEYHYQDKLVSLPVGSEDSFQSFYETISEVKFDDRNTHALLCESIGQNVEIFNSAMIFFVLYKWSAEIEGLVQRLSQNNLYITVYLIHTKEGSVPKLADNNRTRFEFISTDADLLEVMGR